MKVAVIGLGSMGKRRLRLIKALYPEFEIIGIDGRPDRREEAKTQLGIEPLSSINDLPEGVECAFVCTSPLTHSQLIQECLEHHWHVFTEMNLVPDGYKENVILAAKKGCVLFLSSTFLYREEIGYIRSKVTPDKKWNYIYHIGQYLPDWHPWENYKDYFIGDKRTNGCREIMAIELPWITATFGDVSDICTLSDKMSNLSIDFKDNFLIQVSHSTGNKGVLVVDVVSPLAVRKLEVYSEGEYISWNGTPESLCEYNCRTGILESVALKEKAERIEGYRAFVVENAYKNEIKAFFDVVLKGKQPIYDFQKDLMILKIINQVGA